MGFRREERGVRNERGLRAFCQNQDLRDYGIFRIPPAGAFCQNQDLRDYRIFRIRPARASSIGKRLPAIGLAENAILKIPQIL